ncbi:nicotinate-nicotinamide nucleotide adenylyltransferase [Aspergillus clavatus NRRL 1]|uniref:Cytidylyltransferase, putative n=1 Tax=Aspergillus clavatus (strain ATCC 1007 / CBS 513.65 / DSM 816 / NCTC 3887 / NRRL 1 / QM 1276 / 107) TaxID=344612 RepID=A1CH42_ASPCL|nr:cytidylyltransferase, putative [Aspergillus clavatus NRRL 1]EAW10197.1 cytidylyltransferase, putative [Aspergillus clavatus NRRL 1]
MTSSNIIITESILSNSTGSTFSVHCTSSTSYHFYFPVRSMASTTYQTLRAHYHAALKRFIAGPRNLEVLSTIPSNQLQEQKHPSPVPEVLYVLDSSFNPPTCAHLRIANSALLEKPSVPSRLLLLLATQNADKPSKPASFEDRLAMMELFAQDLWSHLQTSSPAPGNAGLLQIDIGVTKRPYFVDKAAEIEKSDVYPEPLEQVHLTGYDTLIRIFNPKYYPPEHTLQPLGPFLSQHRLRVTMRPSDEWGSKEEQEAFLLHLAQGGRENEGGKREWAQRIQLVEGKKPGDPAVSSTKAREAIHANPQDLEWLVPDKVREYILSQRPYAE